MGGTYLVQTLATALFRWLQPLSAVSVRLAWLAEGFARARRFGLIAVMALALVGLAQEPARASELRDAQVELAPVPAEFSEVRADWLVLRYSPEVSQEARRLLAEAAAFRPELEGLLGLEAGSTERRGPIEVRLGRTALEMEKLGPKGVALPRYASGVAFPRERLILLTARPRYPGERFDLPEVFRHELAHIALADRVGADAVPRWFNEGFAIFASREAEVSRMQTMWTATLANRLIPLAKLERGFPRDATSASVAYAQAADVVRYLYRGDGAHRARALFERAAQGQSFADSLRDAFGLDIFQLETEWQKDAARRYTFWPILFASSTIWLFTLVLFFLAYRKRRAESERKLARMGEQEALEDALRLRLIAMREAALALRAQEEAQVPSIAEAQLAQERPSVPVPFVEHDGHRHTLH